MKRIVAIVLIFVLMAVCLVGCATNDTNTEDTNTYDANMIKTSNTNIMFWTDETTGVQYIIYDRSVMYGGMGGITPRLNADGTLYTE